MNKRGRVIFASLVGTSIEFYDFYIYATAAVLVFPALFFPHATETTAQLQSFAVFGVAFIARPLGSIVFGHLGDRIGRKATLIGSLLTMGIATFLIGCLPTALTPGWEVAAPTLLVIMRFFQGIGLGGEWSGAALLATENAPQGKRAIYGTFPQLGAPIGFILANVFFLVLSSTFAPEMFAAWGWRVPFLASAAMVALGLWVRLKLVESPAFQRVQEQDKVTSVPLGVVLSKYLGPTVLGTFNMLATYVLFYLLTTFTLTYGTRAVDAAVPGLGYTRTTFLLMMIIGVVFFGIFVLVAGPLAERFGRRKSLMVITAAIGVFGFLWVPLFGGGTPGVLALLILGFTLMGLTFGPMGALLPEMFPTNVRYTGSAVSYNVSSILGAALAPFISVYLWGLGAGSPFLVGLYLTGAAVLTMISLFLTKETRDLAYEDNVG
ncbi:metabolite-proton symporter [Naumannella halotolerans]|uniref:Metabolite-proton symporter n=1 Tax=Naumannella halotolerans TaxID=993414 RepID=A0A4R7J6Y4_9ACTN|nr:metabolite-proton symporter [Naumannella halotolerans]